MATKKTVKQLLNEYYDAFNKRDDEKLTNLLHPNVVHDINQGSTEIGRDKFKAFMERSRKCAKEEAYDLHILTDEGAGRGSAEFKVKGTYLKADPHWPEAPKAIGQTYDLPIGSFFECKDGFITRVTVYYNMPDWIKQVENT